MGFNLLSLYDVYTRRSFAAAGLRKRTTSLDDETTITYWTSPTSTDPPLLLIHGFGTDATWQWHHQVRTLSSKFSLLVPDLLFFGGSTTTSPYRSEAFQAECILRLLDKLHHRDNVSVVGTSYGGFVAYHLARLMGERVRKVVIASSDLLKDDDDEVRLRERAAVESVADLMLPRKTEDVRKLLRLSVHRLPWVLPELIMRQLMKKMSKNNMKEKIELMKELTVGKEDFELTPLPQDVLIVWGEHDKIFLVDKAHAMKRVLGARAKLEILKKTSHVPQLEDPVKFNEAIMGFLSCDVGAGAGNGAGAGAKSSVRVHVKM